MSNHDDTPIDLKQFKRKRAIAARNKAVDAIDAKTWKDLCALWQNYANGVANAPDVPNLPRESHHPSAVFITLLGELVSLAQALKLDDSDIIDSLLLTALTHCESEGRLHELMDRAWNLLDSGDEEAGEKLNAMGAAIDALMAQGMTSEEAFAKVKAQMQEAAR